MNETKTFIFLELRDPEVCTLLNGLRLCFNGRPSKSNVHLTVRGPYITPVTRDDITELEREFGNDVLTIGGPGCFSNNDEYVVYLKVASPNLEKIWWKRDFPKKDYGFNPHISLYRGNDPDVARSALAFLQAENIRLLCAEYELTPYVSNQYRLLDDTSKVANRHFLRLVISGRVKADVLERACDCVGRNYGTVAATWKLD